MCNKAHFQVKVSYPFCYGNSIINGRPIKDNGRIVVESPVNQALNKYRDEWYPNGKKIVPSMVYDLNPLGLAVWFMDDGSYHKGTSNYYFATDGFSLNDVTVLVDMLKTNFSISATIHQRKNKYVLYIPAKSRERFTSLIYPYLCNSMLYKIGHNKQGELLET